jgi:hypothetical protein
MRIVATDDSRRLSLLRPFRILGFTRQNVPRLIAPTTAPVELTDRDAVVDRYENAVAATDYLLTPITAGFIEAPLEWRSSNPAVATVSNAVVEHVAPGVATITADAGNGNEASLTLSFAETGGETVDVLKSYVEGSLAHHIFHAVNDRVLGKNPATQGALFTTRDHATPIYTRNANVWASDIDLTCCAVYTSTQQPDLRAATLIAPDVVHMVTHYEVGVGGVIRFVTPDNEVIERTVISRRSSKEHTGLDYDVSVARLNAPVPESISPAKVMPANWLEYIGQLAYRRPIPCIDTVPNRRLGISLIVGGGPGKWMETRAPIEPPLIVDPLPEYTVWKEFWNQKVAGASGNPAFWIINGEAVFLHGFSYSWAGNHLGQEPIRGIVNAMMTALGSPYQLTPADLSAFPTYE